MLSEEEIAFKTTFVKSLEPFIDYLNNLGERLDAGKWQMVVHQIEDRIISNPEQYLGKGLPSKLIIKKIINEIFEDYLIQNVSDAIPS